MKVGIKLGKVKKFGIGWCIPHRMAADNAKGGSVRTPPTWYRVKIICLFRAIAYLDLIEIFILWNRDKAFLSAMSLRRTSKD